MEVRCRRFEQLDTRSAYDIWRLRQDVFVVEQQCPYPDLDGRDDEPGTRHLTLHDTLHEDTPAGYLRLLDDGDRLRIGRVLLLRPYRGRGLADLLMRAAIDEIGERPSRLDAQTPLADWYAGFGYLVCGPEFLDDDIAHLPMERG